VYEQGKLIGYADVSAGTIGLQAGGETFSELILFKDKNALDKFVNNQLAFDAKASAVAIKPGVAAAARYSDGVAIFARTTGGLMVEAAVGGQKFTFRSLDDLQRSSGQTWDNSANTSGASAESARQEMRAPTTMPGSGL
jgi:lipid-binding SYLF domain-containing protein